MSAQNVLKRPRAFMKAGLTADKRGAEQTNLPLLLRIGPVVFYSSDKRLSVHQMLLSWSHTRLLL
jgi:hypothetical protein